MSIQHCYIFLGWRRLFVNGSGAAELSHFSVGAAEPRELEGTQVKVGEGVE